MGAACGRSKMADVGRGSKMAVVCQRSRVVVLGAEEQGELDLCGRVLTLRVLGHRAGLEWNHDGRWLTGSPDGDDGAVVAILVRMMW